MQGIEEDLNKLKKAGSFRTIPDISEKYDAAVVVNGIKYVNFASNDYLGLSTKTDLRDEFLKNNNSLMSSASARLLTGSSIEYKELESTLASLFNRESALIFNTGYQANLGVISAIAGKGDVVFSDKLNHASIIDGMKLSDGEFYRYKHLDYDGLEKMLMSKRGNYKRAIIVSESLFSMDGDIADVDRLVELKNKYNCLLMIDEAHAFCACGKTLSGLSSGKDVDIITATLGKAVGSFGAFCVSSNEIKDYLVNKARSFIFSTSIPPINISWSNWLLSEKKVYIIDQKQKLEQLVAAVHKLLKIKGINTPSVSHIIPVIIGENNKTLEVAEKLKALGYYIPAIRPPTVPIGTSRLRISLTSDCKYDDFERVLDCIIGS